VIVCIPSKGRPNTKTHLLFESAGFDVYHFIEPQDYDLYNKLKKVNIGKNNGGVYYVRQFIVEWAKQNNQEWVLMCDDDITDFGIVENGKCVTKDARIFYEIISKAKKLPFTVYGISFRQYAWSEKKSIAINSKVFTAVTLLNIPKITWKYRQHLKEDIMFLFDSISNSYGCAKFNHYFFNTPPIGSNKGGCYDDYKNKKDIKSFNYILNEFKGYTKVISKKNGLDIKWDFKGYAEKYKRKII